MKSVSLILGLGLVVSLELATAMPCDAADEPRPSNTPAATTAPVAKPEIPATPAECRRLAVEEMRRFRRLSGPTVGAGGDEHIGGWLIDRFRQCQTDARIALASTGDRLAIGELIREFDLKHIEQDNWSLSDHVHLSQFGTWPPKLLDVVEVLEAHDPVLAGKIRLRMLSFWRSRAPFYTPPTEPLRDLATIMRLSREGIDDWAMLQWLRLDPKGAMPVIQEHLANPTRDVNIRVQAARAAATVNDPRAIAWLKEAVLGNVGMGGATGAALLEAGDEGAKQFFQLARDYQLKHPGKPLPYGLTDAPGYRNSPETLWRHLPALLDIKDQSLHFRLSEAIGNLPLPAKIISELSDRLRKSGYDDEALLHGILTSFTRNAPNRLETIQATTIWINELQQSRELPAWKLGAELFVKLHLGNRESAAAAARRELARDPLLATRVLAITGTAEDAPLIWTALHRGKLSRFADWYDASAQGWWPILRLTSNPAAQPNVPKE